MLGYLFKARLLDIYGRVRPILNEEFWLLLEANRNIVNVDHVDKALEILHDATHSSTLRGWIDRNVKNYLLREYEHIRKFELSSDEDLKKYPDWVRKAVEDGKELHVLDLFTPDRYASANLIEFSQKMNEVFDYLIAIEDEVDIGRISVPEAIRQSDNWHTALTKKKVKDSNEEAGTELVKKYPDGYRWVEITAPDCLNREGVLMQHCVGSYGARILSGGTQILSLRDEKNDPHITMEYRNGELRQIKGKQNKPPEKKYHEYVIDFVKNQNDGFLVTRINPFDNVYGLAMIVGGEWATQEEISKMSSPHISEDYKWDLKYEIPKGLEVSGILVLIGDKSGTIDIPDNVKAVEIMNHSHSTINKIGDNVTVKIFRNLDVKHIGKNFTVTSGTDNMEISSELESIGDGLSVARGIKYSGGRESSLKSFPKRFSVGRSIRLSNNKLKSLGVSKFEVNGELDLSDSAELTELPDDLRISRSLRCNGCKTLYKMPTKLRVGRHLNISDTEVRKLPEKLTVPGDLYLPKGITEFPDKLNVGGSLNFYGVSDQIKKWPSKVKIGGIINASDEIVKKLRSIEKKGK